MKTMMSSMKYIFTPAKMLVLSLLMFPLLACAQAQEDETFKAGVHYQVLSEPVKSRHANKIEVIEMFWYGCSHCYSFEPTLHEWSSTLADDVSFTQSPAMWRDNMVIHARAFYTAKALKNLGTLHEALFKALNVERNPLATEQAVGALFAKHGVDSDTFSKAYNSFSVTSGVRLADSRARSYKITGTPEMVVNGKYRTSGRMAGSQKGMLDVVDFLIEKERKK